MKKRRIVAFMLLFCCVGFAGCQPTPDQQAVVNKAQGLPSDALVEADTTAEQRRDSYEPVEYVVSEHWKENVVKDEKFSISADVDVMRPEVELFPVQKLVSRELTQEMVDGQIAYFAGEQMQYYQMPAPLTKEYYEEQILQTKESLAKVEAGGDGESPDAYRTHIKQLEKQYADAPTETELTPADTKFTYRMDYDTGEPRMDTGQNEIFIGGKGSDGVNRLISAMRGDNNQHFAYGEDSARTTESEVAQQEEQIQRDRSFMMSVPESDYREQQIAELDKWNAELKATREQFAQSNIDLEEMQGKAIALLKELGITGVQITKTERALFAPDTAPVPSGMYQEGVKPSEHGCYIEFQRENGGVPCVSQQLYGGYGSAETIDEMYSAPFFPEGGRMLFDETGRVRAFWWNDMAQPQEQVSADSKVIPFKEAKERLTEQLYRQYASSPEPDGAEIKRRFVVQEVRLVMGYIDVKDEPEAALAVPAWQMKVQAYETWSTDGMEVQTNKEEILLNALDGSPILMPGRRQALAEMEKLNEQEKLMQQGQAAAEG